jgi:rhodanese-related sulfurtransferase
VVEPVAPQRWTETGTRLRPAPEAPPTQGISPRVLQTWLQEDGDGTVVLDLTTSANYVKRHIPGAWYVLRARLAEALRTIPGARRYVLTCGTTRLARFAVAEVQALTGAEVVVLEGGTLAWIEAGLPLEQGETRLASPRIDRYRRPYEGTGNAVEAMQAYLDWEFGLVGQLARDGTHFFNVV